MMGRVHSANLNHVVEPWNLHNNGDLHNNIPQQRGKKRVVSAVFILLLKENIKYCGCVAGIRYAMDGIVMVFLTSYLWQ